MYSIQPRDEEPVINDTPSTRRVLHAVPDLNAQPQAPKRDRSYLANQAPIDPAAQRSAPAEQTRKTLHNDVRQSAQPLTASATTPTPPTRSSRRSTYMPGATAHQLESARSADSSPMANPQVDQGTKPDYGSQAAQPLTRKSQNAQLHQRAATGTFPAIKPKPKTGVRPLLTDEQLGAPLRQRTSPVAAPKRTRPSPQVFNVEDYGPLSPESEDLTTANAQSPLDLREPSLAELMWMQEMRYHLRTPQQPALSVADLSKTYNEYCTAWNSAPKAARWDQSFAVTSIGIAIGDHLVESSVDCHWMVSESNGSLVFGVRDDAKRATYFPIDAVNRRWFAAKLDWIPGFIRNARDH